MARDHARGGDECRSVECLIADLEQMGIESTSVLAAIRAVPRDRFVPEDRREHAWENRPLDIGGGQTISQPYTVARMAELAAIGHGGRVLDIGAGSGYAAAVAAQLVGPRGRVAAVERLPELVVQARRALAEAGYRAVRVREGDGRFGWPELAPYDSIVVAAQASAPPTALLEQLAPGGTLVIPIDVGDYATMTTFQRVGEQISMRTHGAYHFVPLV